MQNISVYCNKMKSQKKGGGVGCACYAIIRCDSLRHIAAVDGIIISIANKYADGKNRMDALYYQHVSRVCSAVCICLQQESTKI